MRDSNQQFQGPGRALESTLLGRAGHGLQNHRHVGLVNFEVSIRVRKAGTRLGLFVTYSNNPKQNTLGKLWLRKDFGEQDTLTYVVDKDVAQNGEALAIRSSDKSGELATAVKVERAPGTRSDCPTVTAEYWKSPSRDLDADRVNPIHKVAGRMRWIPLDLPTEIGHPQPRSRAPFVARR